VAEPKRGTSRTAAQRAETVVADLARRGELRARDLQRLARELVDRAERNRTELTRLIQKEINRQVKTLGLATQDEVDALRKRVSELERPKSRSRSTAKKS
jgi:polyhydroxyalkanoate synthesis regulator phasin